MSPKLSDNTDAAETRLLELFAARRGPFRLESGHHGSLWLDLELLFKNPGKVRPMVESLAAKIRQYDAELIAAH